jgi:hypothetical protein
MVRKTESKFSVGDRVQTVKRYGEFYPHSKHVNNLPRRGEVTSVVGSRIRVLFDGNKYPSTLHHTLLENES